MVEVFQTDFKQRLPSAGAAHAIEEIPGGLHPEADEIEVLFHPVHSIFFLETFMGDGFKERAQVTHHLTSGRIDHRCPHHRRADLLKHPRIPNGAPAQHQPMRTRFRQHLQRPLGRVHIAVG